MSFSLSSRAADPATRTHSGLIWLLASSSTLFRQPGAARLEAFVFNLFLLFFLVDPSQSAMADLTPHTSHLKFLTPHTSHLTPHTSHLTPHSDTLHQTIPREDPTAFVVRPAVPALSLTQTSRSSSRTSVRRLTWSTSSTDVIGRD